MRSFHSIKKPTFLLLIIATIMCNSNRTWAQSEQQYNRFQYHKQQWLAFHTAMFHVYYPVGYDSLASYVVKELPLAMKTLKHRMAASHMKTPAIIIYPSLQQYYESNIGLYENESYSFPTFLKTGRRHVVAFNGSRDDLKAQLYEALARSVWDAQMKEGEDNPLTGGAAISEDKIPFWFREGAIRYYAHRWPVQAEDELKRSFQQHRFSNWEACISYQPRLSGQAFCYFLATRYYPQAVMQLCHQLKKKNLSRAVRLITKRPLDSLFAECHQFYWDRFDVEGEVTSTDTFKNGIATKLKRGSIHAIQLSADASYTVQAITRNSNRTVYLTDNQTGKAKKISKRSLPPWIDQHSQYQYPLIKWNEAEHTLNIVQPKKSKLVSKTYFATGSHISTDELSQIDGLTQFNSLANSTYLLAAFKKGQSDIVLYDRNRERYIPLTLDQYDDVNSSQPDSQSNEVFFSSIRPSKGVTKQADSLRPRQGIYKISNGSKVLPVITDTLSHVKWNRPTILQNGLLLATHTLDGIERFAIFNDPLSGKYQTIGDYEPIQYLQKQHEVVSYRVHSDSIYLRKQPFDQWVNRPGSTKISPWLADHLARKETERKEDSILNAAANQPESFISAILQPKNAKELAQRREDSISQSLAFQHRKVKPYILQLHSAYFTAKVNNDYYINRYQPYAAYQGQFKFPELGGMIRGGFTDMFEDHHVNIAFRLPVANEGSDLMLRYRNTKKNVDWGLSYFRKVEMLNADPLRDWRDESGRQYPNLAKVKTHYYEAEVSYPLSYYLSASITTALREDRTIFLATEKYSLNFADFKSLWWISTPSLSYNKLRPTVPFLYKGFKAKVMADVFKAFTQQEEALLGLGAHFTYYQPLYRYITLETKLKAGYTNGDSKVLYNLGGTDNNVINRIDSNVHFSQTAPYAFQTLVTPFRGHLQNTLYGDQYALINADLYFPLFQTLIPVETPLPFINLLQPGIFADAATAKESWTTPVVSKGILWSYGLSLRSSLAGYPLRLDVAWPGTFTKKPVWYFSLSLK